MKKWLKRFLEEKGIDMDIMIEVEGQSGVNIMTVGVICEAICATNLTEQKKIKDMLVMIDFRNGNVMHFITHLAKALSI